ncbi:olfactory receptor 6M1-like [Bombina bombina]|uniref:olfactory receptor 6M1-like n=1 Tax=Bombina bombina TaxID=8345 RepID=UPI00235AF25F|nr:olfactory receptor 6M1-like [Bombina bombina]
MENGSTVTNFILVALPLSFVSEIICFYLLFFIYLITLAGNSLIIVIIWKSHNLHIPMYFFIANLSFLEIWYTTTVLPKLLAILSYGKREISFWGCLMQCYFYFVLGSVELLFLAVMSFDRYMAICYPLRYTNFMNPRFCLVLVLGSWVGGFGGTIMQTILIIKLPFCNGNHIDHFYCDVEPLLKLACTDISFIKSINLSLSSLIVLGSLVCIIVSYSYIITAIHRLASSERKWKCFSTCASHLILVFIVYGSSLFLCMRSVRVSSMNLSQLSTVLTGVVTPLLNPFIYTLRNKQVKDELKQLAYSMCIHKANSL